MSELWNQIDSIQSEQQVAKIKHTIFSVRHLTTHILTKTTLLIASLQ